MTKLRAEWVIIDPRDELATRLGIKLPPDGWFARALLVAKVRALVERPEGPPGWLIFPYGMPEEVWDLISRHRTVAGKLKRARDAAIRRMAGAVAAELNQRAEEVEDAR